MPDFRQITAKVSDCHPLRRNPQVLTPHQMEALKASIMRDGFLAPVLLRARAEGGYEVVSGNHRVMAARELEMTHVPALVTDLDDDAVRRVAVNLNTVHGDPSAALLAPLLAEMADDLLSTIHLDGSLLADVVAMDATLRARLEEMSRPDHLDSQPATSPIRSCICPRCGKQHLAPAEGETTSEGASDDV